MEPSSGLFSLLAQIPVTGLFIWFVMWMKKQEVTERKDRDSGWQGLLQRLDDSRIAADEKVADALNSSAASHREALEQLAATMGGQATAIRDGQHKMMRQQTKMTALLLVRAGAAGNVDDGRKLIREIFEDE